MPVVCEIDYEGFAEKSLPDVGVGSYIFTGECRPLMAAYRIYDTDQDRRTSITERDVKQWIKGDTRPAELVDALGDPHVEKWAFNASFERLYTEHVMKIKTGYEGWRCTMVLAYMHGFAGGLEEVGERMGIPERELKMPNGKRLINLFCQPQKITKRNSFVIHDDFTDPDEWEEFCRYNRFDVVAEHGIKSRLQKPQYVIPSVEWEYYEIDQRMNDRGLPMDMLYINQVIPMVKRRKDILIAEMKEICGLANPNSRDQLLPWLRARGYWFNDLQAHTVEKVLVEHEEGVRVIDPDAVRILRLRTHASRMSVRKYDAALKSHVDGRLLHCHQFRGAQRTGRDAGRLIQHQNLPRTPRYLEYDESRGGDYWLEAVTEAIRAGDYDLLELLVAEPMDAFKDCLRGMIRARDDYELRVADLSSIETCVTAWITRCVRLLRVFEEKKDPYKDFATEFYQVAYDAVEKWMRQICKPPVLGSTYGLSGGELEDGKKTGLWGYAENMGVKLTREQAHKLTAAFRAVYKEVVDYWEVIERAAIKCVRTGQPIDCWPVRFEMNKPYLNMVLPSGRRLYYFAPRLSNETMVSKRTGNSYTQLKLSYMGKQQNGNGWRRIFTSGTKLFENEVQAIACDVMWVGAKRAHEDDFSLVLRVHDELGAEQRRGDNYYTLDRLIGHMKKEISWAPGLPLGAAGWTGAFYRK